MYRLTRKTIACVLAALVLLACNLTYCVVARAGTKSEQVYPGDPNNVFWIVQMSDSHVAVRAREVPNRGEIGTGYKRLESALSGGGIIRSLIAP